MSAAGFEMSPIQDKPLYSGEKLPSLGLGTWKLGGAAEPDTRHDDEVVRLIQLAIELGCRHIDTAEGYGGGHAEELVGRAIKKYKRDDIFVTTKVSPKDSGLRQGDIERALPESLRRLDSSYIDLYLIHWPSPTVPLKETFRALNHFVEGGFVRYLGVSNFDLAELREAMDVSDVPIATNQVPYNLFNRTYQENGVLPFCQEAGIVVTAYRPVLGERLPQDPIVREIATDNDATPAQVALHWVMRHRGVITLVKTSKEAHLRENIAAIRLDLPEKDLERLNRIA